MNNAGKLDRIISLLEKVVELQQQQLKLAKPGMQRLEVNRVAPPFYSGPPILRTTIKRPSPPRGRPNITA